MLTDSWKDRKSTFNDQQNYKLNAQRLYLHVLQRVLSRIIILLCMDQVYYKGHNTVTYHNYKPYVYMERNLVTLNRQLI